MVEDITDCTVEWYTLGRIKKTDSKNEHVELTLGNRSLVIPKIDSEWRAGVQ